MHKPYHRKVGHLPIIISITFLLLLLYILYTYFEEYNLKVSVSTVTLNIGLILSCCSSYWLKAQVYTVTHIFWCNTQNGSRKPEWKNPSGNLLPPQYGWCNSNSAVSVQIKIIGWLKKILLSEAILQCNKDITSTFSALL